MAEPGQKLESYTDTPYIITNQDTTNPSQADRNASLNQITTYIYQSLLDFQGKWEDPGRGEGIISMPNARYLAVGDKITNLTTGKTYVINEVIAEAGKGGIVRLNTFGALAPTGDDALTLETRNMIIFESSYSRYYLDKAVEDWRDMVVYRVKRREPGTIGKHPFDPPTEIKPRVRESREDTDHPGCHVIITGQWFDNLIQFDCWSKFNNRADDLVEWFEDFMYKYTWVWKKNGVNEILYWMRNIDTESSRWRNDLAVRTVTYYFRTEKIVTIKEYDFRQIDLYLGLDNVYPSGYIGVNMEYVIPASGRIEVLD
jgi:hypothetical protein